MPATWYGGTLTSAASSSAAAPNSTEPRMYDTRCLWRSTAAFGGPVVPLVKSRIAISSASIDHSALGALPPRARHEALARDRGDGLALAEAGGALRVGDEMRGRDLLEQALELGAREPVVQRHERHAGPGRREQ